MSNTNLIVVLGATATGKTRFAAQLAYLIQGEIISADSRQIYKHMDLGTGKDYQDYHVKDKIIPSHLIDICEPGEKYNVYLFQKAFYTVFEQIHKLQHMPILCGGTGMYIEAVTKAYALPEVSTNKQLREKLEHKSLNELKEILAGYKKLHNKSDIDTRKRAIRAIEIQEFCKEHPLNITKAPEIHPVYIGMHLERDQCRKRIKHRLDQRLEAGMVQEVQSLLERGIPPEDLIYYGLEYKFITNYLLGNINYNTMTEKLYIAICQFSKRQMTWFRRMQRNNIKIHWIDAMKPDEAKIKHALQILKQR